MQSPSGSSRRVQFSIWGYKKELTVNSSVNFNIWATTFIQIIFIRKSSNLFCPVTGRGKVSVGMAEPLWVWTRETWRSVRKAIVHYLGGNRGRGQTRGNSGHS
jgi:hypothetical protein